MDNSSAEGDVVESSDQPVRVEVSGGWVESTNKKKKKKEKLITWRMLDWNILIENDEDKDKKGRVPGFVVQVLASPLLPLVLLSVGIVFLGVWQGVDTTSIPLLVFTCLFFMFAAITYGIQQILIAKPTGNNNGKNNNY
jgi:hypothetical protein